MKYYDEYGKFNKENFAAVRINLKQTLGSYSESV